jgi:hypothetical protein
VTGEWSRLHNEGASCFVLLTKYCKGDKVKGDEMDGHVESLV